MVHASRNGSRHLTGSGSRAGYAACGDAGDATSNWIDVVLSGHDGWGTPAVERRDSWLQQQQCAVAPNAHAQTVPLGNEVVSAIIPARRRPLPRTPGLPIAPLATPEHDDSAHYALTAMDARGRLADRSAMRVLRWEPGQPIAVTVAPGALLVLPRPDGPEAITQQGHLRLPAAIRYALGLTPGDRLLVAAFPDRRFLVTYTIATLDTMILAYHRSHTDRPQP